jgi:hypothetical protein
LTQDVFRLLCDPAAHYRIGDGALVSPGSEPGLSRSISEPVRNVVGWALSLATSREVVAVPGGPAFLRTERSLALVLLLESAVSGSLMKSAGMATLE